MLLASSTKIMKIVFFILLYSFVCTAEEIHEFDKELPGYSLRGIERELREQDKDVHRPCPFYDVLCIRRYLAKHSKCKIAQGPVPEPYFRAQSNNYIPSQNVSVIQNKIYYTGITGSVTEFYVNRKDELTVLAVEFKNLKINATSAAFRYFRRGQEPVVTNSSMTEFYPSFTTTTVFRGVKNLRLPNSESTAFVNAQPAIYIDPRAGIDNTDPTIAARFASFVANINVAVQEAFLTEAPFYAGTYIQNVLCDFGLKIN